MTQRVERGAVSIITDDGLVLYSEHTIDQVDDWRQTPVGLINFGHVKFGPQTWKAEPMKILLAPGFWQRVRSRWILMQMPNYRNSKHDLRNVWTGK